MSKKSGNKACLAQVAGPGNNKQNGGAGTVLNFATNDPFADAAAIDEDEGGLRAGRGGHGGRPMRVDIRMRQRNGRKSVTTVENLPTDLDLKKILKAWKTAFSCNGSLQKRGDDDDDDEAACDVVIQLQGDQRLKVKEFLVHEGIVDKDAIKIHGF